MEGDDFEWKPPSEAEMKVLQARRERSDKISKLMGDYLLKGYRMLGSCCTVCGTILLRDRQQEDYCVCCSELDTDQAKDDPAVSASAAKSQVQEHELCASSAANHQPPLSNGSDPAPPGKRPRQASPRSPNPRAGRMPPGRAAGELSVSPEEDVGRPRRHEHRYENHHPLHRRLLDLPSNSPDVVPESMDVIMGKLYWASQQLKGTSSVEASTQLCTLIKACAEAMTSLRYLVPGETD